MLKSFPDQIKDFVEHLRTVHFSLVVICVSLVVLNTSRDSIDYVHARAQNAQIKERVTNWSVESLVEGGPKRRPVAVRLSGARDLIVSFDSDFDFFAGFPSIGQGSVRDVQRNALSQCRQMLTISDFKVCWNRLHESELFLRLADFSQQPQLAYLRNKGDRNNLLKLTASFVSEIPAHNSLPVISTASIQNTLFESSQEHTSIDGSVIESAPRSPSFGGSKFILFVHPAQPETVLKDDVVFIPLLLDDVRASEMNRKRLWYTEPFAVAFQDLNDAISSEYGLPARTFDEVDSMLENKLKNAGADEKFDAFGVKFPALSVTKWGTILILAVQLYFSIHLRETLRRVRARSPSLQTDVAWIGIYPGWSSQVLFSLATFILPTFTIAVLTYSSPASWFLFGIVATLSSAVLSSLTYRPWRTLLCLNDAAEDG